MGRICSVYSASAPSVKPACHHAALRSHRSSSVTSGVPANLTPETRLPCHVIATPFGNEFPASSFCSPHCPSSVRAVQLGVHGTRHGLREPRQRLERLQPDGAD